MPAHRFVLRLPPDVFRKMDALGRIHSQDLHKKRSTNDEIVDACRAWIARQEQEHGPIAFIHHSLVFESDESAQQFRAQAELAFAGLEIAAHLPEGDGTVLLTYESPRPLTPYEQERFTAEVKKFEGVLQHTFNLER